MIARLRIARPGSARFQRAPLGIPAERNRRNGHGFTLIELMVVIAVILILAGLVLSISGYAMNKGARSRAEAEIAAMSAALESYKADNGIYAQAGATNSLDARTMSDATNANASQYRAASLVLYRALSGDRNLDRVLNDPDRNLDIDGSTLSSPLTQLPKSYFTFKSNQLFPRDQSQNVQYIGDPFGNPYGYSTANQNSSSTGYNPTFDLWSTGNSTDPNKWIKNW